MALVFIFFSVAVSFLILSMTVGFHGFLEDCMFYALSKVIVFMSSQRPWVFNFLLKFFFENVPSKATGFYCRLKGCWFLMSTQRPRGFNDLSEAMSF